MLLEVVGCLADADHRNDSVEARRRSLPADQLVVLVMILTTLGVPDDHVVAIEGSEEGGGDFARERSGLVRRNVLSTELEQQLVGRDQGLYRPEVCERGEHRDLDPSEIEARIFQAPRELLHERNRLQVIEIELPVARDEGYAICGHECHPRISSPGRFLPSRNSRLAPPPVEM